MKLPPYSRFFTTLVPVFLSLLFIVACDTTEDEATPATETSHARVRGTILESQTEIPLQGVTVSIGDDERGWAIDTTDAEGKFDIKDILPRSMFIRMDGSTVIGDEAYASVHVRAEEAWVDYGANTVINTKYLPKLDMSSALDLSPYLVESTDPDHPADQGWMQIKTPDGESLRFENKEHEAYGLYDDNKELRKATVHTDITDGTFIKLPKNHDPILTITPVPIDRLPHSLPDHFSPHIMYAFQPSGTVIDPPLDLNFSDVLEFHSWNPNRTMSIWSMSASEGVFLEIGTGAFSEGDYGVQISPDPNKLTEGRLAEFNWKGPTCTPSNNRWDGGLGSYTLWVDFEREDQDGNVTYIESTAPGIDFYNQFRLTITTGDTTLGDNDDPIAEWVNDSIVDNVFGGGKSLERIVNNSNAAIGSNVDEQSLVSSLLKTNNLGGDSSQEELPETFDPPPVNPVFACGFNYYFWFREYTGVVDAIHTYGNWTLIETLGGICTGPSPMNSAAILIKDRDVNGDPIALTTSNINDHITITSQLPGGCSNQRLR